MRYVLLALFLLAAGVLVGHLQHEPAAYAPIARVRTSDGLYITLVQPRTGRRSACATALVRFGEALARSCPRCAMESADCAARLEGIDRSLANGERVPIYTIAAGGIRAGLLGPPRSVAAECQAMASQFVRSGIASAACIAPITSGSS